MGQMDAILKDPHLDIRIKIYFLINAIVPKLEYALEVWEGNAKFVKELETVQMTAAKKILRCSNTTSNIVLRAALGMYPLKTIRDVRKMKWQYKAKNMPEKRLPAIVDMGEKTKGGAGIRWNDVVEKIWNDLGRDQEGVLSIDKFGRYKKKEVKSIKERERLALRNKVK